MGFFRHIEVYLPLVRHLFPNHGSGFFAQAAEYFFPRVSSRGF
jgi:hypothetical protein